MSISDPQDRLLKLSEVLKLVPVSKSTWWEGVRTGRFPQPVKLGLRMTRWRKSDIDKLIASGVVIEASSSKKRGSRANAVPEVVPRSEPPASQNPGPMRSGADQLSRSRPQQPRHRTSQWPETVTKLLLRHWTASGAGDLDIVR